MDCIFCRIANGEIKSDFPFETQNIAAFRDINPIAPTHILIITKNHYKTLNDLPSEKQEIAQDIIRAIQKIAKDEGIDESGYRIIANVNKDGGQEIPHLHLHLIGGRPMEKMG